MQPEVLGYSEGSSGSTDWKEGTACRSITEQLKTYSTSLPITAQDSLYELVQTNNALEKKIMRGVNNWQTYETRYFSDSDEVEVLGHLSLHLYLQPLLLEYAKVSVPPSKNSDHTGIVIDARGVQFSPVVLPEVLQSDGTTLLSADLQTCRQEASSLFDMLLTLQSRWFTKQLDENPSPFKLAQHMKGSLFSIRQMICFLPKTLII